MHVFHNPLLTDLVLIPLHDGLGVINPLLEKKQLGAGGGQVNLRHA